MSKGKITLPETCPRGLSICYPVSQLSSSNEDFVCCGIVSEEVRVIPQDKFRLCFKTISTDTMYDHDQYDLKSLISVISQALVVDELMEDK